MKGKDPTKLGSSIENLLSMMGAPPVSTVATMGQRWGEIVGPKLSEHSRPIELIDGVLTIGCTDSSWASQLGWLDSSIKERFEAIFPGQTVSKVRVRITE